MPAAIVTQLPEATSPEHRAALIMVAFLLLLITFGLIAAVRAAGAIGSPRRPTRRRRLTPTARPAAAKGAIDV